MPYKSKRTRDLQGEVTAGSGITVTEQTKPDGTKEYTITNGDPASAITVDGTGLSLISNVLRNTMAAIMGWSGDDSRGAINWTDDNDDTVLKIIPLEELFIGDAHDNNDFIIKHINGENRLIRGTLQIAESINSTEGVSLNTLADMVNSAAQYQFAVTQGVNQGTPIFYCDGISELVEPNGDYYDLTETTYNGYTISAIQVKQGGVYELSLHMELMIGTSNTPALDPCQTFLGRYAQGSFQFDITVSSQAQKSDGTDYMVIFDWSGFIELKVLDYISVTGELGAFIGVLNDLNPVNFDPYLSIRKVR